MAPREYRMADGAYDDRMHEWAVEDTAQGLVLGFWINQEEAEGFVDAELDGDRDRYIVWHRDAPGM